jgi:Family of unknown function (DUF5317)/Major Facilitator Superfamily
VFLLGSIVAGLLLSMLLGGRLSSLAAVRFRLSGLVAAALALQVVLFSRLGASVPDGLVPPLHYVSYALLIAFGLANLRLRSLTLVFAGLLLNVIAIASNGGHMPVSETAARAAGMILRDGSNVSVDADRLRWLGDVFAMPSQIPFASAFSVGDVLLAAGAISFIVLSSVGKERRHADVRRFREVARVPPYRRLLIGTFISQLGDWLTLATVVAWVYADTRSVFQVAVVLAVRMVPAVVGGFGASALLTRLSHLPILPLVELFRGCLIALATAGVLAGERTVVLGCLFLSGVLAAISRAVVPALVPRLTPPAYWSTANAGLLVAADLAMVVGAAASALVVVALQPAVALALDTLTFAVAGLLYLGMPRVGAGETPARARLDGGIRLLLSRPQIAILGFAFASATLATGLVNPTLPRLLGDAGMGANAYGMGFAALASGLVLGQVLFGAITEIEQPTRWMAIGLGLMAGLFVVLGLSTHGPTALLVLACIGLIDGSTDVAFQTAVQRETAGISAGQVFGCLSGLFSSTLVIAVALAPIANGLVGPGAVIMGSSAFLVFASALSFAATRRMAAWSVTAGPVSAGPLPSPARSPGA